VQNLVHLLTNASHYHQRRLPSQEALEAAAALVPALYRHQWRQAMRAELEQQQEQEAAAAQAAEERRHAMQVCLFVCWLVALLVLTGS
jgi:hypothetical protein